MNDKDFKSTLWKAADKLRAQMDAAEYKHIVLGLIFLKYISDTFEVQRTKLEGVEGADPEDRDVYAADNVFWVPASARWAELQKQARSVSIGSVLDEAMASIEKENERLRGVLHKSYARPELDKRRLGELIDAVSQIELAGEERLCISYRET